jgi:hypothetical protein
MVTDEVKKPTEVAKLIADLPTASTANTQITPRCLRESYFSTRMKSPVEALTATVSLADSRLAP